MQYPIELAQLRVGKIYFIENYRDHYMFTVTEALEENNYLLTDVDTMETYQLRDIFEFGIGENFRIEEQPSEN